MIEILVRKGFGENLPEIKDLTPEEIDRLTSRSNGVEENLKIEFEIEKEIKKYGESLCILFSSNEKAKTQYSLQKTSLQLYEQKELIRQLRLPTPETLDILDEKTLDFPFIIKNAESRRGREVYLIKNEETLQRFMNFLSSNEVVVPSLGGLVKYDPSSEKKTFIKQKFIDTPSEHFTTYRITVSCTGKIFSSVITYSGDPKNMVSNQSRKNWLKRDLLTLPDSPFYLNSPKIVSNKSAGGGVIVIDRLSNSIKSNEMEKEIIVSHGLELLDPKTPEKIKKYSVEIAKCLGQSRKGMVFGVDWIQSKDGELYYLETNIAPAAMPFIYTHKNGIGTHKEGMVEMMKQTLLTLSSD